MDGSFWSMLALGYNNDGYVGSPRVTNYSKINFAYSVEREKCIMMADYTNRFQNFVMRL